MNREFVRCIVMVWMMTGVACYAQNTAVRPGSAEFDRLLRDTERRNAESEAKKIAVGDVLTHDNRATFIWMAQIIDESNSLVTVKRYFGQDLSFKVETDLWVEGPTKGLVDGQRSPFDSQPLQVVGTKQYETISGATKTIFRARLISLNELAEMKAKAKAATEAQQAARVAEQTAKQEALEAAKRRQWTSADGKYTLEATFAGLTNGVVTLEKDNGQRLPIRLEQLSKEDQDFIRDRKWLEQSALNVERSVPNTERFSDFDDAVLAFTFESDTFVEAGAAGIVTDLSERENNGVLYGPLPTEGKVGVAIEFDGKDDYVLLDLQDDLTDTKELTVAMWLLARDTRRINFIFDVRERDGKAASVIRLFFDGDGKLAFGTPGGEVRSVVQMSSGWHHVVGTWKNGIRQIYLDGKLISTQDGQPAGITDAMLVNTAARIGSQVTGFRGPRGDVRCFAGAIDEFLILRRALSPSDAKELYQLGVDGDSVVSRAGR
jgi:type II secretory pathway pseudopilin PulG